MSKKEAANLFVNVVFNGVFLPLILTLLKVPSLYIIFVAAFSMFLAFLWGHSPHKTGWRRGMMPLVVMSVGVCVFGIGVYLFFRQSQEVNEVEIQQAVTSAPLMPPTEQDNMKSSSQITNSVPEEIKHANESAKLTNEFRDSMNSKIDIKLVEINRRQSILRQLTELYMMSNDGISSRMAAGMELPPADFLNEELEKLGESWRVHSVNGQNADIYELK